MDTPAFDIFCMTLPGIEPMYVRRCPRIQLHHEPA